MEYIIIFGILGYGAKWLCIDIILSELTKPKSKKQITYKV